MAKDMADISGIPHHSGLVMAGVGMSDAHGEARVSCWKVITGLYIFFFLQTVKIVGTSLSRLPS